MISRSEDKRVDPEQRAIDGRAIGDDDGVAISGANGGGLRVLLDGATVGKEWGFRRDLLVELGADTDR